MKTRSRARRWRGRFVTSVMGCLVLMMGIPTIAVAQTTVEEFRSAFESGDSTRCMEAGNALRDYREYAAELAAPLVAVVAQGGNCGESALGGLINLGPEIRDGVAAEQAMPVLMEILERALEPDSGWEAASTAESAVLVLGNFGDAAAPAVPLLERMLMELEKYHQRRYVLLTLAEIGDAAAPAVPTMLELLGPSEDESYERGEIRFDTARALGSIPAAAATTAPALVAALSSEQYSLPGVAADALSEIGGPAVPFLVPELESDDVDHLETVISILGDIGPEATAAAQYLIPLLSSEDWNVSYEAKNSLRKIGPAEAAVPGLIDILENSDNEDAQEAAVEVLWDYGSAAIPALPALREAATSGGWSVKQVAAAAVEEIEATGE